MNYSFELPLLALLILTAGSAILVKDLLSAVLILGTYSFFLALVWAWLGAVDVAFVEAVVGAGLATVFFLLTLFRIRTEHTLVRRSPTPIGAVIGLPLLGVMLLYAVQDLPAFGDPNSPASSHVSPYYIENSLRETETPNIVTAVLMDYRALDTMLETGVIFTAGLACWLLLRRSHA